MDRGRSHAHRFLIGSYAGVALLCALPLAGRLLGSPDTDAARYAWFSVPPPRSTRARASHRTAQRGVRFGQVGVEPQCLLRRGERPRISHSAHAASTS